VVGVEQWAELRREHFVCGVSINELVKRTGLARNTVRAALRSAEPPRYSRAAKGSKLDPFKAEIGRLLGKEPGLPGVRVGELLAPLGWSGGKTILDDYLREIRRLFLAARTTQRAIYRPAATRPGWVVIACLGYSRAGAGTLIFSKQTEDLLAGIWRCLWQLGGLPDTLVWDRQAGIHGHDGRPSQEFAGFCGQLKVGWHFCRPRDPQAKGVVERLQGYAETNFEPGRVFANELDFQDQLDAWFLRVNARQHRTTRARPVDRLAEELALMSRLPATAPDTDRRWVTRVSPDPYVRFDSCDYSLDPDLVGRKVEIRVSDREVLAVALDTGELACRHARSFARHRTITALEHARALKRRRDGDAAAAEPVVETRSLDVYDALIA